VIIESQISITCPLEMSGLIMEFFAGWGTIADLTQTVLPDDFVRSDFVFLTYSS